MAVESSSVDPRIERSRAAIMATASEFFIVRGYAGTNLDDLATAARVSKKTVYNVVGDKERLFRQVAYQLLGEAEEYSRRTAGELAEIGALEPGLRDAAVRLARMVLGGPVIPLRRLLIAEVERFPELAAEYYDRGPGLVMSTLAGCLGRLSERGLLAVSDPEVAAEHLAFLIMGAGLDRALFRPHGTEPPAESEIEARAHAGVDAFLAAYRAAATG